ncbi:unnamed protein product [Urochloa humidicola]
MGGGTEEVQMRSHGFWHLCAKPTGYAPIVFSIRASEASLRSIREDGKDSLLDEYRSTGGYKSLHQFFSANIIVLVS